MNFYNLYHMNNTNKTCNENNIIKYTLKPLHVCILKRL